MSSAFYPQGMNTWNNRLPQGGYKSWKGKDIFSNPVGVTATHIRPLTNNDPGNVFPTGFGLPRPMKHYRKGTVIPVHYLTNPVNQIEKAEQLQIDYNVNRAVKSANGASLGGGSGGSGLISQMIDGPGQFIVKDNKPDTNGINGENIDNECKTCDGIGLVSSWYPINNLTEKPQENVTNPLLCCNQQRKARQRVLPTNTIVKKDYYQTQYMYLYNRCQTFEQRQFNFVKGEIDQNVLNIMKQYPFVSAKLIEYAKPGSPLSLGNLYVAQCNPNSTINQGIEIGFITAVANAMVNNGLMTQVQYNLLVQLNPNSIEAFINFLKTKLSTPAASEVALKYLYEIASNPYNSSILEGPSNSRGCSEVYYKPNNPQYAQQGGVSSSTRILKLNVDTISTNAANVRRLKGANSVQSAINGNPVDTPFIYKFKAPTCSKATYSGNPFFFQGQHQNHQICSNNSADISGNYVSVNQQSRGNYIGSTLP
uniref:Uncharacterized protein n=1 Tax=viral metagenome TaxID=1070528 RepID=A0A6C0I6I1_9ZZZZ